MKRLKKWTGWRRLAARTGIAVLLTTGVVALAEPAHAAAGCSVSYAISPYPPSFRADVQIYNIGDPITSGWTLAFDLPPGQQLITGWPVTWTQTPGTNHVTATSNAPWNHTLQTGVMFPIGFLGNGLINLPPPTRFTLNGTACNGGTPPTLTVTSPSPGQIFSAGADVPVAVIASDPDIQGAITVVEFRIDGLLGTTDPTAPYGYIFRSLPIGNHTLTATAIDNGAPPQRTTVTVPFRIQ